MSKKRMYNVIYRLRKRGGVKIDTRKRTIFYEYLNPKEAENMKRKTVLRLCNEFGFVRQAELREK